MAKLLRVLLIEDSDDDAQLLLRELRRNGFDVEYERIDTRAEMEQALFQKAWDIILCDYKLPRFHAMKALAILKESGRDIPFFVVSGTIQEEAAAAVLKAGAHDFIVKGRYARLMPAIEREMQDAEARRANRKAQAERAHLTANLESVSEELERFLYMAFHDLRSPLITIKGFLGLLSEDIQANRLDRAQSDIERIRAATNKLEEILSGLIKLSRVGRVVSPSKEVNLLQLTEDILQTLEEHLHSKNITFKVSPKLPVIYGDMTRLRELMENLIENAIKYTEHQENPVIEIGTRSEEGQQVIFVKDNGPGIDPRYHNRIFNLFEKLDPTTEGSGIGLALVKRVIEVHGGKVWVESDGKGHGSTFCFTIPDSKNQAFTKVKGSQK